MTDHRNKISELNERRHAYSRINELKSNCEKLKHLRENLRTRLSELNEAADKLVSERNGDQAKPCPRTDPLGVRTTSEQVIYQNFTSASSSNDLNDKYKLSSRNDSNEPYASSQRFHPSDAFKRKLSHCLNEVVQRAEEIVELSEQLTSRNDHHYEQIP